MSIKTDQLVKEQGVLLRQMQEKLLALSARVDALENNIIAGDDDPDVSRETERLALLYEQKFGKPPHHRMKAETIAQALRE